MPTNTKPRVVVIAPLPPPVTGMTAATRFVVDRLKQRAEVIEWTTSGGDRPAGLGRHVRRAARYLAGVALLVKLRLQGVRRLYSVANSGSGLWFDIGLLTAARCLGYQVTLHHQVYSYVRRRDRRMAWVDRVLGRGGAHVFLCDGMRQDFANQYASEIKAMVAHNPAAVERRPRTPPPAFGADRPLRLGHLSNLTIEKGLDLAIATFERLAQLGLPVTLELAGPARGPDAERLIEGAVAAHPGRVTHLGPVYGEQKQAFLERIDVMLLPTNYDNEAQPLVLMEALAAAAPAIAFDRGCIGSIAAPPALYAYPTESDYVDQATEQIAKWVASPDNYAAACRAAGEQSLGIAERTDRYFNELIERLVA